MDNQNPVGEAPAPRVVDVPDRDSIEQTPQEVEETLEERLLRLRAQRERLELELEARSLEEEIEQMESMRDAVHTPAGFRGRVGLSNAPTEHTPSEAGTQSMRGDGGAFARPSPGRPHLREPRPYQGKTLKEARSFLKDLEVIFALAPDAYPTDQQKVLYGVMFLAGEPDETWHHRYRVDSLEGYTWEQFRQFVQDAVDDPVNRGVRVTLAYEGAQQKEGQSIQAFASELATMEEQLAPYSEEQRVRHLLAKLQPALRNTIIKHHAIPATRQELVSLGSRIESTDRTGSKRAAREDEPDQPRKRGGRGGTRGGHRNQSGGGGSQARRERDGVEPPAKRPAGQGNSSEDWKKEAKCFGCGKTGHIKPECRSKHLWKEGESHAVRKVSATDKPADSFAPGNSKGSAKERN